MSPQAFCEYYGFSLETEEYGNGLHIINIHDPRKILFATGKRKGKFPVPPKNLPQRIEKGYTELMDLILESVFI